MIRFVPSSGNQTQEYTKFTPFSAHEEIFLQ